MPPNAARLCWLPVAATLVLPLAGCGSPRDKALLLKDWEEVCVPLDIRTFRSLDEALAEKGYGNVMASDLKLVFLYRESQFDGGTGPGIIVYSDESGVPASTAFTKMRVWQFYEAALADPSAGGIHVNPDAPDKNP